MILRLGLAVARIPVRHARMPNEKLLEKAIDKVVFSPFTSWLKRKMKTNPRYEARIRQLSHWWTKATFRSVPN